MKKEYQSPELDVEILDSNDVVLASDLTDNRESPFNSVQQVSDIWNV